MISKVMKRAGLVLMMAAPVWLSGCLDTGDYVDPQAQLDADIAIIDAYIAEKGLLALKDPSGIRIVITELGTKGLPPRPNQTIKIKYVGSVLNDPTPFESNTANSLLSNYIPGWQLGAALMPNGSKFTLYIPSPLAYGNQAVGNIPKNSILEFKMELQDVVLAAADKQRLATDIVAIDKYLTDNGVANVVKDTTGIRYVVKEPGTGSAPTWYESVTFNYTGKILSSGAVFSTGTAEPQDAFKSRVVDYVHGLKVALQHMPIGSKLAVYVPSVLAFGSNETPTIPANSNIYYELELKSINP